MTVAVEDAQKTHLGNRQRLGMDAETLASAFEPHTQQNTDRTTCGQYRAGFRGEALASIARFHVRR